MDHLGWIPDLEVGAAFLFLWYTTPCGVCFLMLEVGNVFVEFFKLQSTRLATGLVSRQSRICRFQLDANRPLEPRTE